MEESKRKCKQYQQKFRSIWLENELFCDWLARVKGSQTSAYCKVCKCFLRARMADLINHRKSKKHNFRMENFKARHHTKDDDMQELEDNFDKDEHCSSPLRLSDNENNFDIGIEINENSDIENDTIKLHSSNHSSKHVSKGLRRHQTKYISSNFPGRRFYKFNLHDDPELSAIYPNLVSPPNDELSEDELAAFGRSIVAQMRKLPEYRTVRLSNEIQNLVTRERIEYLEEQRTKENATQNPSIISYSYKTADTSIAIQSDQVSTM